MAKYEGPATQNRCQNAGKTTTTIKTITLTELPDGESSKVSKKLRKTPLSGEMSDKRSGNAVSTKSTITNNSLQKRARKFKYQFRNNNIIINNMFYQYKIKYQYKQNYYMTLTLRPTTSESKKESQEDPDTAEINRVQPTSTSRLTSGLALRSTLRLTLYNTIYVTLTLRPLTLETNMESHKDPDNVGKNWVQPNSPSRLTSGLALRSTLRFTLTLSGNNNTNVYQYITIYMTLTLRPTTSETNMESHKNWVQPTSTLRLTPGLASRSTLRLTLTLSGNNLSRVVHNYVVERGWSYTR
jgi:hypothetical protein